MTFPPRVKRFSRPNVFEIDLGAIARCVRQIRHCIGPDIHFFATLKSNAYGYGLIPAAKAVLAASASRFWALRHLNTHGLI